jgi:hypothetical protein
VKEPLDWEARTDLATSIRKTLEYHVQRGDFVEPQVVASMNIPARTGTGG